MKIDIVWPGPRSGPHKMEIVGQDLLGLDVAPEAQEQTRFETRTKVRATQDRTFLTCHPREGGDPFFVLVSLPLKIEGWEIVGPNPWSPLDLIEGAPDTALQAQR